MRQYNGESIRLMTNLVLTNSTRTYNQMMEMNLRELIETVTYIKTGKPDSFKWLMDNKHLSLAAFANAARGDKTAFRWLMQHKAVFWAATANAVNKDKKALAWHRLNKFIVYAELAEALIEFYSKDEADDVAGYYKPPG